MLVKTILTFSVLVSYCVINADTSFYSKSLVKRGKECGSEIGKCPESKCCSQWGYCGTSDEYCGNGCNDKYGKCGGGGDTKPPTSPIAKEIRTCVKPGTFALTFDDGPGIYTEALLKLLKDIGVKATFFINAENIIKISKDEKKWIDIVKKINDQGHQVASHTYSHAFLDKLNAQGVYDQMIKNEKAIAKALGKIPTCMRFPYGAYSKTALGIMGVLKYKVLDWNVDSNDYKYKTDVAKMMNDYKVKVENGNPKKDSYITLQHDIYKTSALVLPTQAIKYMVGKGYKPVTIIECIGGKMEDAYRAPRDEKELKALAAKIGVKN